MAVAERLVRLKPALRCGIDTALRMAAKDGHSAMVDWILHFDPAPGQSVINRLFQEVVIDGKSDLVAILVHHVTDSQY
jgi:hypothetical protein